MRNPFSSHRTLTIAGSLVAIFSIAAIAQAATDTIYKYTTPKIGNFAINPMTMAPDNNVTAYSVDFTDGGRVRVSSASGCFTTSVNLPQGATMTGLTTFWSSTAGGTGPTYTLARSTLNNGAATIVASGTVPDNTGGRKAFKTAVVAGLELVNNNQHYYTLAICIGTGDAFYGGRIGYTYTQAGA